MFLHILKSNNIKFCSGDKKIYYNDKGVKIDCWSILGAKKGNKYGVYPLFTEIDNPEYTILYCGKILDYEPVIIGIDIDDYTDIPVKDKLMKYGFNENIMNYKWITKSAKNGLHIICKYNYRYDLTTTKLIIDNKKSCIDIRGTGGKLVYAGSKTNKGDYEWINDCPNQEDKLLCISQLSSLIANSIEQKKTGNIDNVKYKEIEKIETQYLRNNKKKNYEYKSNHTKEDCVMYDVMLEKLKDYSVDYTDWCVIGMILSNEFKSNEMGFDIFDKFSQYCKYKYDYNVCENIWKYWKDYDVFNKYNSLNKSVLLYYLRNHTKNSNIFNECRNEAKKILNNNDDKDNMSSVSSSSNSTDYFINEQYLAHKKVFEKEVFKVRGCYYRKEYTDDNESKLTCFNTTQLRETFGDYAIIYIPNEEGKLKKHYFLKMWLDDPNKKRYYNATFRPSKPPEFININDKGEELRWLNNFTGFQGSRKPINYNPSQEKINDYIRIFEDKLLMLNENKKELRDYCFHFIRKMILYPEQKSMNVMICFISSYNGLGKTSFIEFLQDIIGSEYAEITDDCDRIFAKHSQMRHNKIMLCYNEGELSSTYSKFNKFKSLITDKRDKVEFKNIMETDSNNLTHLFFCSNFVVSVKIADGDRRHYVVFGTPPDNKELFNKHKKEWFGMLEDPEAKYIIYDYIVNYKTDSPMGMMKYDFGNNIPQTDAKTTIQEVFIPVEQQFLRHLCKSNFKEMNFTITKIPQDFLKQFYIICGNEEAYNNDRRIEYRSNWFEKDYSTIQRYNDLLKLLENHIKTHNFLDLYRPFDSYFTRTKLKNLPEKERLQKLIRQALEQLSINVDCYDDKWLRMGDEENNADYSLFESSNVKLYTKRNIDIVKPYVRININCFISCLNFWRSKGNNEKLKLKDISIINNFKQIYNIETGTELMKIKHIKGNYILEFNKEEVLQRVEQKYSFSSF